MGIWEIGKKYKLILDGNQVFTAEILALSEMHVSFRDKNGQERTVRIADIKETRKLGAECYGEKR